MKLLEVKKALETLSELVFKLPNGELVPSHFHVTEIGKITKEFIDCGGTVRKERVVSFQLWSANDYQHRLQPQKLLSIIELSENTLEIENLEVEVEYQADTIGKFGLRFNGTAFLLTTKETDCLAKDKCGVTPEKTDFSTLQPVSYCDPNTGCC